jgi:hypothetical protein
VQRLPGQRLDVGSLHALPEDLEKKIKPAMKAALANISKVIK